MTDTQRIEELERTVSELKSLIEAMRKNTNQALTGHAKILERLVDHTNYVPSSGNILRFPRTAIDVGEVITG